MSCSEMVKITCCMSLRATPFDAQKFALLTDVMSCLFQLCESCTKLEKLTMDQCRSLTSESLFSVSQNCPMLRCFSIEYNIKVGDEGVHELVKRCPLLERLHLNSCGITLKTAQYIAQYCANISVLDLRYCSSLTDDVVEELVKGCQYLHILNLSLCFDVTDVSLKHIVSNCSTLRSLYLVHCKITDSGKFLEMGANGFYTPHLRMYMGLKTVLRMMYFFSG